MFWLIGFYHCIEFSGNMEYLEQTGAERLVLKVLHIKIFYTATKNSMMVNIGRYS